MTADQEEEDPLLYAEQARERAYRTPFPWFQLSILFMLQTARYLPTFAAVTFIPDLIRSIGVAKGEKDVGYYVGLLTTTVYGVETATTFHLSQLSDLIGRKTVFLGCTIALSVFTSCFGLSTTFWTLILCQVLIGTVRGTRGVTRSMLAEMTDTRDIARVIAYYETAWYLAGTFGSKIGGSLSKPVEQFPQLFGSSEFLKKYPFFLPCAICSVLLLIAWLVGTIFLTETLAEPLPLCSLFRKRIRKYEYQGSENTKRPLSSRDILVPGVIIAAINLSSIYLLQGFYFETQALYLSTPIKDGGLGLSLRAIGTFGSIRATVIGLSQLFIFPPVHDKWGSKKIFVLGLCASFPLFILWPLMNWTARRDGYTNFVWFGLGAQICCSAVNEFAWLAISVFITQSYGTRAAIVGFCEMAAGILTSMVPIVSNSLFSLSMEKGYLGGYMVYVVFLCTAVLALFASSWLPRCDTKPGGNQSIELEMEMSARPPTT